MGAAVLAAALSPAPSQAPATAYRPRRAYDTDLYRIVLDHVDTFVASYDELYEARYGPWRAEIATTFRRFLDCGVLANGFLRVRCSDCRHEVLVPWSCKRSICPSCAQRRSVEFADFADGDVLEEVPHSHVTFTIPKMLRPIFLRDRTLLRELSACAWKALQRGLRTAFGRRDVVPGAVMALATAGDLLNGHPHVHAIVSHGAWTGSGQDTVFRPWQLSLTSEHLEQLFRRYVLRLLTRRGRIEEATAERLLSWQHSGFSVFVGAPIQPMQTESRRRLARYLLKSPLSLERLGYDPETCMVTYRSHKRGKDVGMSALDFLAEIAVHIPDRGRHQVLYYGRYSKRSRGDRHRRPGTDCAAPAHEESPAFRNRGIAFRVAWAALLARVWGVDAMACPHCGARMEVVAGITAPALAERILRHIGLFDRPRGPTPHTCRTPPTLPDGQVLLFAPPAQTLDSDLPANPEPANFADSDPPFAEDSQDPPVTEEASDSPFADD